MTYGEFLRHCYGLSGAATKKEFAERVGMKDPDHLIGAMNDRPDKKPSLDLLERAAKASGVDFQDYIINPKELKRRSNSKLSRQNQQTVRQLGELLERGGEAAEWLRGNVLIFHRHFFKKR